MRARRSYTAALMLLCTLGILTSYSRRDKDTAITDADGTTRLTRVIPMPSTISPEVQKWLDSVAQ